jgi:hypothetical protein
MKIAVGIIVFNSDFVLRQAIDAVLPFASAVCVAEGPVKWWQQQGVTTSADDTNVILDSFGDKIRVVHGQYEEKTEQCRAWFNMIPSDTDYIICVDADEVHKPEHLEALIKFLEKEKPTSVGFQSASFFGGFDRIIGGFERAHSFKRVLKYAPGCEYRTHRQPTLSVNGQDIHGKDILGSQLFEATGIEMCHYSYVSPQMVHDKIRYYEGAVISKGNCIPNYFQDVWLNWVQNPGQRLQIEQKWKGVQEFMPKARGECYTEPFMGSHPDSIQRIMPELIDRFENQLTAFL